MLHVNSIKNLVLNENTKYFLVWDLDKLPLPFESKSINDIFLSHTLEHLIDPLLFMSEIHRILKSNSTILISLPVRCSIISHKRFLHGRSYFGTICTDKHKTGQSRKQFELLDVKGGWQNGFKQWLGDKKERLVDFFFTEYTYVLRKVDGEE